MPQLQERSTHVPALDSLADPGRERAVDPIKRLLERHAMVHAPDVGGSDFTLHRAVAGLTPEQLRARPSGANSIAWIVWHLARVEDGCIAGTVLGQPPLLDDAWKSRLGVDAEGDGEGMTRDAAARLGDAVDPESLFAYRDAVGRRTRDLVQTLPLERLDAPLSSVEIDHRVTQGLIPQEEAAHLARFSRSSLLWWWAVEHNHYHLGQAAMIRGMISA